MAHRTRAFQLCLSALMCGLLIVSTLLIRFPLPGTDVLFTAQVLMVLLCGLVLPIRSGLYSVCGYLFLGLVGLPVFSYLSGPAAAVSPSFGYLLGFPFAVIAENLLLKILKRKKSRYMIAALAGLMVIYLVALPYIALLKSLWMKSPVGIRELLSLYCFSFLPLDVVKAILAALFAPVLERSIQR